MVGKLWKGSKEFKHNYITTLLFTLLEGNEGFVVYCDVSQVGLLYVLMQHDKVIAYVSRKLKVYENNYLIDDLGLAVGFFPWKYEEIIFMVCILMCLVTIEVFNMFSYKRI